MHCILVGKDADRAVSTLDGDIWQNTVVYVRFDACTDFKKQVALTTLPETP